jgi:hypothetical protein
MNIFLLNSDANQWDAKSKRGPIQAFHRPGPEALAQQAISRPKCGRTGAEKKHACGAVGRAALHPKAAHENARRDREGGAQP